MTVWANPKEMIREMVAANPSAPAGAIARIARALSTGAAGDMASIPAMATRPSYGPLLAGNGLEDCTPT